MPLSLHADDLQQVEAITNGANEICPLPRSVLSGALAFINNRTPHHRQNQSHRNFHQNPRNRCRQPSFTPKHSFFRPRGPFSHQKWVYRKSTSLPRLACATNQIEVYLSHQSSPKSRRRQRKRSYRAHDLRSADSAQFEDLMRV